MNDMRRLEPPSNDGDANLAARRAFRFILLIGALSFFADFTYQGSRSILGPYLGSFGANAAVVGIVTGFGELAGYGLGGFGVALAGAASWGLGMGVHESIIPAAVAFCVLAELAAVPMFIWVGQRYRPQRPA